MLRRQASALGRLDSRALWAGRPRYNSPTNPQVPFIAGQQLKKPHLVSPMLPEEDRPKMQVYGMGKDWVVIYTKEGRPYYYNHTTEETTWVHPRTGVVVPPAKPPVETQLLPWPLKWLGRLIFFPMAGVMLFSTLGGSPLLAYLMNNGDQAVVQVRKSLQT